MDCPFKGEKYAECSGTKNMYMEGFQFILNFFPSYYIKPVFAVRAAGGGVQKLLGFFMLSLSLCMGARQDYLALKTDLHLVFL